MKNALISVVVAISSTVKNIAMTMKSIVLICVPI